MTQLMFSDVKTLPKATNGNVMDFEHKSFWFCRPNSSNTGAWISGHILKDIDRTV